MAHAVREFFPECFLHIVIRGEDGAVKCVAVSEKLPGGIVVPDALVPAEHAVVFGGSSRFDSFGGVSAVCLM